jgi:beta-aspartyl-peptidase (threonine type)
MKIKSKFNLIVHGGAWNIPKSEHKNHLQGVEKAVIVGYELLLSGKSAIKTVVETVKKLEEDATFDAGRGSFLNKNGEVEMDAIAMNGNDLSVGAVAAIQNVSYPVEVADLVRNKTEHILLVGEGATQFALQHGVEFCPTENLLVGRELERYKELKRKKRIKTKEFFISSKRGDTVGAVAMDVEGCIAVATSTGGTPNKMPGRVGDSPIIGAGAYADSRIGGVSSTGWGESIMKVMLAKTVIDNITKGMSLQRASDAAIEVLRQRVDGRGGVICIDTKGLACYAYNTPYMVRAIANQSGIVHIGI